MVKRERSLSPLKSRKRVRNNSFARGDSKDGPPRKSYRVVCVNPNNKYGEITVHPRYDQNGDADDNRVVNENAGTSEINWPNGPQCNIANDSENSFADLAATSLHESPERHGLRTRMRCYRNHKMHLTNKLPRTYGMGVICDICNKQALTKRSRSWYHCSVCSYDSCLSCAKEQQEPVIIDDIESAQTKPDKEEKESKNPLCEHCGQQNVQPLLHASITSSGLKICWTCFLHEAYHIKLPVVS